MQDGEDKKTTSVVCHAAHEAAADAFMHPPNKHYCVFVCLQAGDSEVLHLLVSVTDTGADTHKL